MDSIEQANFSDNIYDKYYYTLYCIYRSLYTLDKCICNKKY